MGYLGYQLFIEVLSLIFWCSKPVQVNTYDIFLFLDPFKKSDMIILPFYMKISKVTFLCKNEYN